MDSYGDSKLRRVTGPVAGVILFVVGAVQLFSAYSKGDILGLLVGAALLSIAGRLLGALIAGLLAEPMVNTLYGGQKRSTPLPAYSVPRSRRVFGQFEEAIEELRRIALEHPDEVEPWTEMLDIVLVELKDGDRALHIFHEGMSALPTPQRRESLGRAFQAMMARHRRRVADSEQPQARIELPPDWPSGKAS